MDKMSQRQAAFRADFRTRIAPAYFGWAHVALIYALGAAAIWYCARQIADLVDRKVRHSTVPVLPWGAVGTLMRLLPDALWYRAIGSSAAQRVAGRD